MRVYEQATFANPNLRQLVETVQHNCHVADAENAQDNPMCIYLMKMREYFRWSHGLPFTAPLPKEKLGKWINERERFWSEIAGSEFCNLEIEGEVYSLFDNDAINDALEPSGLCYSAGYGRGGQAHFHLGRRVTGTALNHANVMLSHEEYARDLTAPPAHTMQGKIFLRKDALQRYIWGKVEEWSWKKPDNAMGRFIIQFNADPHFENSLDAMAEHELRAVLLHEVGEQALDEALGENWKQMLLHLQGTRTEILCRALRDQLADCRVTLPELIKQQNWASIHFYFANYEGFRKLLWPELAISYKQAFKQDNLALLAEVVGNQKSVWQAHANQLLKLFENEKNLAAENIKQYFNDLFQL